MKHVEYLARREDCIKLAFLDLCPAGKTASNTDCLSFLICRSSWCYLFFHYAFSRGKTFNASNNEACGLFMHSLLLAQCHPRHSLFPSSPCLNVMKCKSIYVLKLQIACRMRSLELAGTAGLVVIVAVMGIIIFQSIHTGMPAISSGEMPLFSVKVAFRGQIVPRLRPILPF